MTPVSCECCVISGRGLCDDVVARPEESYQVWCVCVCECNRKASKMGRVWRIVGCCAMGQTMSVYDERHAATDVILEKEYQVL